MEEVLRLDSGVLVTDGDVYRVEEESSSAGEGGMVAVQAC